MVCKIVVLYNSCICNHASHVLAKDAFLRGCVETWVEENRVAKKIKFYAKGLCYSIFLRFDTLYLTKR